MHLLLNNEVTIKIEISKVSIRLHCEDAKGLKNKCGDLYSFLNTNKFRASEDEVNNSVFFVFFKSSLGVRRLLREIKNKVNSLQEIKEKPDQKEEGEN